MKSHDAEKLDVEVKLKVEHLTLVAWDRSVATRLIISPRIKCCQPNQIPCLDWAGSGPPSCSYNQPGLSVLFLDLLS